jgi:hypothetical protein
MQAAVVNRRSDASGLRSLGIRDAQVARAASSSPWSLDIISRLFQPPEGRFKMSKLQRELQATPLQRNVRRLNSKAFRSSGELGPSSCLASFGAVPVADPLFPQKTEGHRQSDCHIAV